MGGPKTNQILKTNRSIFISGNIFESRPQNLFPGWMCCVELGFAVKLAGKTNPSIILSTNQTCTKHKTSVEKIVATFRVYKHRYSTYRLTAVNHVCISTYGPKATKNDKHERERIKSKTDV